MKTRLKLVEQAPIDITLLNRADIEKRDWGQCHVDGDKGEALSRWERVLRPWRA